MTGEETSDADKVSEERSSEESKEEEGLGGVFPPAETKKKASFAERLRTISENIRKLLETYDLYRAGDREKQIPASIVMVTDPDNLTRDKALELDLLNKVKQGLSDLTPIEPYETEEIPNPANPVLHALVSLGEMTREDAAYQETVDKVKIVKALGVEPVLEASVLVDWISQASKEITYFLNAQLIYSEEIKAKYPELLVDASTARAIADKLYHSLTQERGYITLEDYHDKVADLLHYLKIIERVAQHLADYHEEFMARGGAPFEWSPGVQWVVEEEEKPSKPLKKSESEEEE